MKYKILKIYIVEAQNKQEAIEVMNKNPDTLETIIVKEADEKTGWLEGIKKQLGQ